MTPKIISVRNFDSMTRPSSRTTSARSTLDTLLSTATAEELGKYFAGRAKLNAGKVWDGYFKPMLDALDRATRDEVLSSLEDYKAQSGEFRVDGLGALATTGASDPSRSNTSGGSFSQATALQILDATRRTVDDINERNRAFWGQPSLRP